VRRSEELVRQAEENRQRAELLMEEYFKNSASPKFIVPAPDRQVANVVAGGFSTNNVAVGVSPNRNWIDDAMRMSSGQIIDAMRIPSEMIADQHWNRASESFEELHRAFRRLPGADLADALFSGSESLSPAERLARAAEVLAKPGPEPEIALTLQPLSVPRRIRLEE